MSSGPHGYARAVALINAGDLDTSESALLQAHDDVKASRLDLVTLTFCCERLAETAALRGQAGEEPNGPGKPNKVLDRRSTRRSARPASPARTPWRRSNPSPPPSTRSRPPSYSAPSTWRIDAGRATMRAGTAYAAAGERTLALRHLEDAAAIFDTCGARILHFKATREYRRLGTRRRSAASARPGPYGLTQRELQVAQLIAEGNTNAQIAEKLFIGSARHHRDNLIGGL